MSTAETPDKPTVEELLVSIRQAIHGDNASRASLDRPAPARPEAASSVHKFSPRNTLAERPTQSKSPVTGSMNQMRVNLKPQASSARQSQSGAASNAENFSKLREQLYEMGAAPVGQSGTRRSAGPKGASPKAAGPKGKANGFANILSGETRLEDALEKLRTAGLEPARQEIPDRDEYETGSNDHGFRFTDDDDDYEDDLHDYNEPDYDAPQAPRTYGQGRGGFSPLVKENYLKPLSETPETPETPQIAETPTVAPPPSPPVPPSASVTAPPAVAEPAMSQTPASPALTSTESAQATTAAFNKLAEAIVGHAQTGNQSIDQVTRELMRPMLKSWLDDNLPRLVERLVRDEIERVARGGGK